MNSPKKITMADVEKETRNFFNLHWNTQQLVDVDLPYSWRAYNFIGNVPHGDRQGCYALLRDSEIIYIGLGANRGYGKYVGCGIAARLNKHVLIWDRSVPASVASRKYEIKEAWKRKGVTEVHTFGFPSGYGYLASSLEAFLISRLEPVENVTKTASSSNKSIQPSRNTCC